MTNNQYSKLAKKIVKEHFPNLMGEDAYRQFYNIINKCVNRSVYIEQCTNNVASNYFLPGCVRLFIEDPSYNVNKIEEILEFLTKKPNENIDYNFNGIKTVNELYSSIFGNNSNDAFEFNAELKNRVSEKDDGKFIKVGNYTIYNCFTYDTIEKFIKLDDKQNSICYVGNIKSFYVDGGRFGKNAKYACLRNDYREIDTTDIDKNYPYDGYGLSLIIITVGVNGELVEVCSRWNNGAKIEKNGALYPCGKILKEKGELEEVLSNIKLLSQDNFKISKEYLSKEQIEKIILNGQYRFEDVFRPFTKTSYDSRAFNEPELKKWVDTAMIHKPGKERDNFFSTTKNNINTLYNVHENVININLTDIKEAVYNCLKQISEMKNNIKISNKQLSKIVSESIVRALNENHDEFVPERSDDDIAEEEIQFYESLGDCCYRGLNCFKEAIDLIESPFGKSKEKELAIISKNILHISDLIERIWDERNGE